MTNNQIVFESFEYTELISITLLNEIEVNKKIPSGPGDKN
ncbi:hypothetical protein EMIT036CA2_20715 [Chryseobacterium sp. IT-36CA2]